MRKIATKTPLVSICVPTYLQTSYLERTLRSISIQDFDDYELIVSDDSEDDSVKNVVDRFVVPNQVTYIQNSPRLGTPENWNHAISHARGEFIKILHHDDWFTRPESLSRFVQALQSDREADFCFSSTQIVGAEGQPLRVHRVTDEQLGLLRSRPHILFCSNHIGAPSATIFRNSVTERFDPNLKWLVDVDFYIKVLENHTFFHIPEALIATPTGVPHQVTNECLNTDLEIREYLSLFNTLNPEDPGVFIAHLKAVLERNEVFSLEEIDRLRGREKIPDEISAWLQPGFLKRSGRRAWRFLGRLRSLRRH